jgi:ubiquinone/menaquinone biosynthesis C-methylase UbiE
MAQYDKALYWEERYEKKPEPFDWYQRWPGLKDTLQKFIQKDHIILMAGSGNSHLSEEMYEEGYHHITNIDISTVVVKTMKAKYQDKQGMTYEHMDARAMDFQDGVFNVVVDKALIDSILCGEGSRYNVQQMLPEISRVLQPNGVYVAISHGRPDCRFHYLQQRKYGWNVDIVEVPKPMLGMLAPPSPDVNKDNVHYVYVCRKGPAAKDGDIVSL